MDTLALFGAQQMTSRSPEQRARLSRESGLDLNRFDSVTHLVGSLGTRPNARLYEYVILSESLQSPSLPITNYQFLPISTSSGDRTTTRDAMGGKHDYYCKKAS